MIEIDRTIVLFVFSTRTIVLKSRKWPGRSPTELTPAAGGRAGQLQIKSAEVVPPDTADNADGRRLRGDRTRRAILAKAVDIASAEGLEGLSIGRLASELGVSKSGLFAHFGSKQELQLETIAAASEIFEERSGCRSPTASQGWCGCWP